jgi:hypothetical protein
MTHVDVKASTHPLTRPREAVARQREAYGDTESPPHGLAMGVYLGIVGAAAAVARSRRIPVPEVRGLDVALMAAATHRVARLVSKDSVTAPLRMPFTSREGDGHGSEVNDAARGSGVRRLIGELVSCPFCTGQWAATGLGVGYLFAPRATRLAMGVLSAVAAADFLHYGYTAVAERVEGDS